MKRSEVAYLLAAIAATDNRTVGKLDVETWDAILPCEISIQAALAAVVAHRRASAEWLTPKHIIDAVGAVRRERLTRAGVPPIPGDLTRPQELEWSAQWCTYVKDGETRQEAEDHTNRTMNIIRPAELVMGRDRVHSIELLANSKAIPKEYSK